MNIPFQRYWTLLYDYLRPQWRKVALLWALLLGGIALKIFNPQIVGSFLDAAQAGEDESQLLLAGGVFLVLAIVTQIVTVAATYYGEDVGWTATNELRADLALHTLHLDMNFHNETTPGEMIERIDGDVVDLAIFFAQFVIKIIGNILLLLGILVVLTVEDWRIGAAILVYAVLSLAAIAALRRIAVPHWKAAREADADLFGFLEEHLSGTEDLRSSGARNYVLNNLYRFNRQRLQAQRKAGLMNIRLIQVWMATYGLGQIVSFVAAFYLFDAGLITIGEAYLIVYYTVAIFTPLREITNEIQNLQKAGGSIERIEQLNALSSNIPEGKGTPLAAGALRVEFDRVHFSYNDTDPVLQDINFKIEPGKVLGLLGRTGSGKTTITRLLFRLYDVTGGVINLSGVDIRDAFKDDLRHHVGMVTQDVQIFRATVRDNLTFFDRTIPDPQILRVIDDIGLREWFDRLPEGLDTELESGGHSVSAGEAQLLAFARVFLKNPGLVILDEASSRLDPATEQKIERAVDKLLQNRTGIIVAHRLKTVERADHILILEEGKIREYGDYKTLATDPKSRFYQLLKTGTGTFSAAASD